MPVFSRKNSKHSPSCEVSNRFSDRHLDGSDVTDPGELLLPSDDRLSDGDRDGNGYPSHFLPVLVHLTQAGRVYAMRTLAEPEWGRGLAHFIALLSSYPGDVSLTFKLHYEAVLRQIISKNGRIWIGCWDTADSLARKATRFRLRMRLALPLGWVDLFHGI